MIIQQKFMCHRKYPFIIGKEFFSSILFKHTFNNLENIVILRIKDVGYHKLTSLSPLKKNYKLNVYHSKDETYLKLPNRQLRP